MSAQTRESFPLVEVIWAAPSGSLVFFSERETAIVRYESHQTVPAAPQTLVFAMFMWVN
jgi:hypothetical protein